MTHLRIGVETLSFKTGNVRKRSIEARSRNHCCHGKTISITNCVYILSYPAYKVHAPYCIVTFGLSGVKMFTHIIS